MRGGEWRLAGQRPASASWRRSAALIPPEVPRPLVDFVDNGYLRAMFRAGIPGLAALITLIGGVAVTAWGEGQAPIAAGAALARSAWARSSV